MSKVWAISDIHFGHANICKFRPGFRDTLHHDDTILENIVNTVGKRDTLWILGDCFFTTEVYHKFFDNVFCHKVHWIIGNHDTDSGHRQENVKRFAREEHSRFGKLGSLYKYGKFWLSHHPIHPMELRGKLNIHGHTHFERMRTENGELDPRYINICCEWVNYSPIQITKEGVIDYKGHHEEEM